MTVGFPPKNQEGLKLLRFILVLSSFSPLFILWAVRGVAFLPDKYFVPVCLFLAIFPTIVLFVRIRIAKKHQDTIRLTIGTTEDHRRHVLVYLFAMLLPFYMQEVDSWRELSALILALVFILFLFWHLNLHYINILFSIRGYRVFKVYPPKTENPYANSDSYILITRFESLQSEQELIGIRLSNSVYLGKSK